ncbi:MAG: FAD-binding oxidoreductase [Candidatus Limnocylindria bacterium]
MIRARQPADALPAETVRELVRGIEEIVGPKHSITDPAAQRRFLQDFSWYSPMLTEAFADIAIDVVAQPADLDELRRLVALAVRLRTPVTVRGAGTSNYGQSVPLWGGLLIDTRRLSRVVSVDEAAITVEAGCVFDDIEDAARAIGRELRLIPSTRHLATAAGFLGGGWGGLGSVAHGNLRDGNVLAVDLFTLEDPPRERRLEGADAHVVIHTYGTAGVLARVTFPLEPARTWKSVFAAFEGFEAAARFSWAVALDHTLGRRLLTLQEWPLASMFLPVKSLFRQGESVALMMIAEEDVDRVREMARAGGGRLEAWPDRPMPAISEFTWAHTILWSKKHDKTSTWLQLGYSTDLDRFFEQWRALKARFGDEIICHLEFMHLPGTGGAVAQGGHVVSRASLLDEITAFGKEHGITISNPHTFVVPESGYAASADPVRAFKQEVDPFDLLNRGKLAPRR